VTLREAVKVLDEEIRRVGSERAASAWLTARRHLVMLVDLVSTLKRSDEDTREVPLG
jgi:regulator of sigma D